MHLNLELVLLLTLGNLCYLECSSLLTFWRNRDIRKAVHLCPQRWELMGAIRAGGPLRSLVEPNQTIVLQCRFCEDPEENEDDDDIGMWTFVDIVRGSAPVRVPRPNGGADATKGSFFRWGRKPRVVQTEDRSLALRKPGTTDLGLYQCRRDGDNSSIESTVRFLIDMDISLYEGQLKQEKENNLNEEDEETDEKDKDLEGDENSTESTSTVKNEENNLVNEVPYINGTFADWSIYRKDHLDALERVTALSNLHLEAISEWTSWTDCRECWTTKNGIRVRRGVCVLRLPLHKSENDDVIVKELAGLPALACRSALLSRLHPKLGDAARKVPDFIEFDYQGCNGMCIKNDSKSHGSLLHRLVYLFRHRRDAPLTTHKKLTIKAGEPLVIICPDATAETPVHWQKDGEDIGGSGTKVKTLQKRNPVERTIVKMREMERWVSGEVVGLKPQPDNTPFIDSAGVLQVKSAAPRNSGNYVCSVKGIPRGTFQVEVIVRSTLSFSDLMRHFAYVSLVLLSCIMIWCGVVICVSLRERLRKNKYSKIPQASQPALSSPNLDTSDSQPDTPKKDKASQESTIDNAESVGKRKGKYKTALHHPSRISSRAAKADSPRPSSPPTASYNKIPSRLRIRHLSRLMCRSSTSNNDIELMRLLPPKCRMSMHSTNYRSNHPGAFRRCHRRQYSSASFSSADLDDVDPPAVRGPVIVLSQQLFPASQKALRPVPPSSLSLTNPRLISAPTVEPVSTRAHLSVQEGARSVPRSSPALPCSWVPSAISMSVLRARNSIKQAKPASSSPDKSKLNKAVHMTGMPTLQVHQTSQRAGTSTYRNTRAATYQKPRKGDRRRTKPNVYSKPRNSRSQAGLSKTTKGKKPKKHRGFTSSPTKSPVRKKPTITAKPKSSPRRISLRKSSLSRLTASLVHTSKQDSSLRTGSGHSPDTYSPRLSLLYKALPSPKQAESSSISRDHVSSMSFLSNSAGYSAADHQDVISRKEESIERKRSSAEISPIPTGEILEAASTLNDRTEGSSYKRFSVQSAQPNALASKVSPKRPTKPDTTQSTPSVMSRPSPKTLSFPIKLQVPVPASHSQQSMFEIKKTAEKPTQSQFSELPSPTCLSRRPSTIPKRPTQIEQCDSLEKLELVAAFLERSAQNKSMSPSRSQSQSSNCLQATGPQVQLLNLKSTSQGSFLVPPSVFSASSRQSEISLPKPLSPTLRLGILSCTKCNVAHTERALLRAKEAPKPSIAVHPQATHQKSSKILTTFTRRKSPLQNKPSLQPKSSFKSVTQVSQQLLPALISPCAIALPSQAPVVNKLINTGSPFLLKESSHQLKKLTPASRAGTIQSSMSSVRSSTSAKSALNPITAEHREILLYSENKAKQSVSPSNTDSVSRVRIPVEDGLEDERKSVDLRDSSERSIRTKSPIKDLITRLSPSSTNIPPERAERDCPGSTDSSTETKDLIMQLSQGRMVGPSNVPSQIARIRSREREYAPTSDASSRTRNPLKDLVMELSQGKMAGSSNVPTLKAESVSSEEPSRSIGSRPDMFTAFHESSSVDNSGGTTARFRTRSETENRGSSHSDWVAAHHKTTGTTSQEGQQRFDTSKESVLTTTTLRKITSTRFSKHKGYFLLQKPEMNNFYIKIVDTDKLKKDNVNTEQKESYRREPSILGSKERPKSRSRVFESMTQSVTPATAIAVPQIISAHPLWPVSPSTSGGKTISRQRENDSQLLSTKRQPCETLFQPISESTRSQPSRETTRSPSSSTTHPVSSLRELVTAVPKRDLSTKSAKTIRSKPSIHRVRNRSKKIGHITMPTITGPLELKFKQGAKYKTINTGETCDFGIPLGALSRPCHRQYPIGSSDFSAGIDREYLLKLKLTRSLPQASSSPSLYKFTGTTDFVSKSLGEVTAKSSVESLTPKLSRKVSLIPPQYLSSSFHEDSRFGNQLLAREASPVSSQTTQTEKGDINNTCDAEVQSAMRSENSLQQPGQAIQRPQTVLCDESTSFGSLFESTKSRHERLATTEMASQVSNVRTTPEELPKRTNSETHANHLASKRQLFPVKRSRLATRVRSQATTTPPSVSQRSDVQRTNFKARSTRPQDYVAHLPQPYKQYLEPPMLHNPQPLPEARLSRLPIPVRKKSVHRLKPDESRPKPPKIPVYPNTKPTRRVMRKQPIQSSPKPNSGRPGPSNLIHSKLPRFKSPTPHTSLQRPSTIVRQEKPASNLRSSRHHHLSQISPRPLKLGILRYTAEEMSEKNAHTEKTLALADFNSHQIIPQPQITSPASEEYRTEQAEIKTEENETLQESLQSSAPCHSCNMQTDNLHPVFSGALANAAHGIIAISMTRTVTHPPPGPDERDARIAEPENQATEPSLTKDEEESNGQTSLRCQKRSSSQPTLIRKCHQKTAQNQIRRSLSSFPQSIKTGTSVRRDSPSRPQSQTLSSDVFVFEAQGENRTVSVPRQKTSSFLTDVRNFSYGASSTCPAFFQDGFTSVRGISTVDFERNKKRHKGQSNLK